MEVLRDGTFVFDIEPGALGKGLRPSKRSPRNTKYLVECIGAVGLDGVLQVIDDLESDRIDTGVITDAWPFPQIFVFTNFWIVCGRTDIYEYVSGSGLTNKITVANGNLWSVVDFYDYILLTNKTAIVSRNATTGVYASVASSMPSAEALCNYNGQVLMGGPSS